MSSVLVVVGSQKEKSSTVWVVIGVGGSGRCMCELGVLLVM